MQVSSAVRACRIHGWRQLGHLRIWVWKAKVCVLGSGWAGRAGLLSSSEAVGKEASDWGAPCSPSSLHFVSHHPFPGTLTRGPSLNPHLASHSLDLNKPPQ